MCKVLIVDLPSDVRGEIEKIAQALIERGVQVIRPQSAKEFAQCLRISSWGKYERPDLALYFHVGKPNEWDSPMLALEYAGIKVMNSPVLTERLLDRVGVCSFLDQLQVKQPRWYFGYPGSIPSELGPQVVQKANNGHLVNIVDPKRIHSFDELGFYQEVLANPEQVTRTVYWVFGHVFTALKSDAFCVEPSLRQPKKLVPDTLASHQRTVDLLVREFGCEFMCVEFIGDQVIDLNICPNAFFHPLSIDYFCEGIIDWLKTYRGLV